MDPEKDTVDEPTPVIVPEPLFDIKEFLPYGITPAQNGIIPPDKLKKIHCGGSLYVDAARAWLAMVRAAAQDDVFLNLNNQPNAYRKFTEQLKTFQNRYVEVDAKNLEPQENAIRVEFNGKLWQLKEDAVYAAVPGTSSHGYGLAVDIQNAELDYVKNWLNEHAAQFGFVREWSFEPWHFVYIKSRESIPERVLEIENLPPLPKYTADQIAEASGCSWVSPPSQNWSCNGVFYSRPLRAGYLAVLDQGAGTGIKPNVFKSIYRQCAGIICTDPAGLEKYKRPILLTANPQDTIEKLNKFFAESEATAGDLPAEDFSDNPLKAELDFYKKANPETAIFFRKKALAERLLKISIADLQNAPKQPWYNEYLALLEIQIENPALKFAGKEFANELLKIYSEQTSKPERELAVLGMLQFINPLEIPVPLNQHLWAKEMIFDVQGVFLSQYTRFNRTNVSTYWLSRQMLRRHEQRKMRVVFLLKSSSVTFDKMRPVYDALRERSDTEVSMILYPDQYYKHGEKVRKFLRAQYPGDKIYDSCTLPDIRKLQPDYVFFQHPYEGYMPFIGFNIHEVAKFAKVCHISYGASLAYTFIERLFDDCGTFYRNVYLFFCSAETVKAEITKRYSDNAALGYQHFEFLGYPILEKYYQMPATASLTKRILWTPRWSYNARVGGSHFLEFKDKFPALRERYGDKIDLFMRPHMNTFRTLTEGGLLSKEAVAEYRKNLKKNRVGISSTYLDIDRDICNTDIFLTDYSSIVILLFLTGRPIIYCEFPNAIPFPEYEEMFAAMYIAHSWEDVEGYLDDLVAGNDPLFDKRQEVAKKIYEMHKDSTKKIVERILQDFKDSQLD